jgi:hypothetical protein
MRTEVSEHGVLIPKTALKGIDGVELRKEQNVFTVMPIIPYNPMLNLGRQLITIDAEDASINHNCYLYDQ